jgi:hypothetical protein
MSLAVTVMESTVRSTPVFSSFRSSEVLLHVEVADVECHIARLLLTPFAVPADAAPFCFDSRLSQLVLPSACWMKRTRAPSRSTALTAMCFDSRGSSCTLTAALSTASRVSFATGSVSVTLPRRTPMPGHRLHPMRSLMASSRPVFCFTRPVMSDL